MSWPDQPEYLQLFSNEGPVTVRVKFNDKGDSNRKMGTMNMFWHELNRLINPETGELYKYIYFDTYRCPITRYEINPTKNLLTIVVGTTGIP